MEVNTILSSYFCYGQTIQQVEISEKQSGQRIQSRKKTSKHNEQFIQKIVEHDCFTKINHKLTINSCELEPLQFLEQDYVNLICAENKQKDIGQIEKRMEALAELDNVIYQFQMMSQGLESKQRQLTNKMASYKERQKQLNQEQQIVSYENSKLQKQLSQLAKRRGKQRVVQSQNRIQNISPNQSDDRDRQSQLFNAQSQLQEILLRFNCPNGFPKNKTEVLMLINRIEGQIQKIEIDQLNKYSLQDVLKG